MKQEKRPRLTGKPTGRPSSYTEEVAGEICERMMQGKGLLQICSNEGMPDRVTVYRWLDANESFRNRYARAREAQMDFYAEQILAISFDESGDILIDQDGDRSKAVANHAKVQRDRLKVDSLKWTASRLFPKRYGDKMELLTAAADAGEPKTLTISWLKTTPDMGPPERPQPPRQLVYHKPQLPGDLTEADWSVMLEVLELVKRTVPTNDERPPVEIMGVIKTALLKHFEEV